MYDWTIFRQGKQNEINDQPGWTSFSPIVLPKESDHRRFGLSLADARVGSALRVPFI